MKRKKDYAVHRSDKLKISHRVFHKMSYVEKNSWGIAKINNLVSVD